MARHLKQIIADNVRALLRLEPGEKGLARLIKMGIQNGNAQRILSGEVSIGADMVELLAHKLRVEPWQLCVPNLDPARLPTIGAPSFRWPFQQIDPEVITSLVGTAAQSVENGLLVVLSTMSVSPRKTGREILPPPAPPAPPALEPDAARIAAIYSKIDSPDNRRIARALMEQFVTRPSKPGSAGSPPVPEPIPLPPARPARSHAAPPDVRKERRGP